mmetsp:Transcript_44515/g.131902  ORF Transcript_44515/g.131902 Transcript_44515/m.131902 type:complete len:355 (+) Transcript_44515:86-1150(+)
MLSRVASSAPVRHAAFRPLAATQGRWFAHSINVNMIDSDYNAPSSEKTLYRNKFINKAPKEHHKDIETAVRNPVVADTKDLVPADAGDPHNTYGLADYKHLHYDLVREPTFPRKPDLAKGELASGATVTRTDVWHEQGSPAITSVAKFSPENFRPVGWAENAPQPITTVPEGTLDFRTNRLTPGHADRRPWIYFISATTGFVSASLVRVMVCKMVHSLWPGKDVWAAGVVEVDLRQVREGQNFIAKWRNKPVFIRRRTPEMIATAQKDDPIAASMRDPATDAERCKRPEWLICIGVCTHLGCIPQSDAGLFGGYFCPCHGSHYDHAGRLRLGPAPKNLELPPYAFIDDFTVKLG